MTIHCLYSVVSNALLEVDIVPITPQAGQATCTLARDTLPDFAIEAWNPAILMFQTKSAILLTRREFIKRFTAVEYGAIKAAASQNVTLDYYWQMLMLAEYVTLSDPDTVAGVQMLEQAGLIGSGRSTEILA